MPTFQNGVKTFICFTFLKHGTTFHHFVYDCIKTFVKVVGISSDKPLKELAQPIFRIFLVLVHSETGFGFVSHLFSNPHSFKAAGGIICPVNLQIC